jgi:hypothetical protein
MARLQRNIKSTNSFLINDGGELVRIKQLTAIELSMLYQAIMINKQVISAIFSSSFNMLNEFDSRCT